MKTLFIIILCCFCLYFNNTTAQIVYTDIPDTILVFPEELGNLNALSYFYDFDINNDSTYDLQFKLSHHEYLYYGDLIWVIYTVIVFSNDAVATLENGCVQILEENDTINDSQQWSIINDPLLFLRDYYDDIWELEEWMCNLPNSNKYCGLKLMIDGKIYYGWLRLSWTASAVTLKDFAYHTIPDMMIFAGQTVSLEINEINNHDQFIISKYNGQLEITSKKEDLQIDKIRIYGISGRCIRDIEVYDHRTSININNIQTGLYIIQIITSENIFVQKYYISNK